MNKNLLFGLVALIIVFGLIYVFTHSNKAPTKTGDGLGTTTGSEVTSDSGATGDTMLAGEVLPDDVTVVFNGTEFIPQTVTILQGGTVTFKNESNVKMWIGSNNHPTHTLYPVKSASDCLGSSFDECASVDKGGEWSYTFNELGTWGYHNHMRAPSTGSVIVQTEAEYLSTH